MNKKPYDVIILGAGAAGLMCAFLAGQRGLSVLVLEKSNKPGKKILMSGGGRCNFTNLHSTPENFLSANPHFCKSALSRYTPWHFIEMVERHQIPYHEKELGQLFCDRSSKDILNMLLDECADNQVEIRLNMDVGSIATDPDVTVNTTQGSFQANSLVVATGGLSIPKMGGSGMGYELAKQLGLGLLPKRAGLVPYVFTDELKTLFSALAGVAITVSATVPENAQAPGFTHQMLFTHRGLSGPAMLQISSYWESGQTLSLDLLPGVDAQRELLALKQAKPQTDLTQWLRAKLPKKAADELLSFAYPQWCHRPLQEWSSAEIQAAADWLNDWQLKPAGTEGYRTAEVTLGGVDTQDLSSKTMASKKHPHVYFIGEVVDVTGHLGGHNFQWAWASAHAAAEALTGN